MAEAEDRLLFCKRALGELGTRSTITSLDPPDGSQEAYYCNLFFYDTRDQILRAAHWNFASISDILTLWKAAPGTPENPTIPTAGHLWSVRDPTPGWLYSYIHPTGGILQFRRIISGSAYIPFDVGFDTYDRVGNVLQFNSTISAITITNQGIGYAGGDYIEMVQTGAICGRLPIIQPTQVDDMGRILLANIMYGGSFVTNGGSELSQASTTGTGSGFAFTANFVPHPPGIRVILTNAQNAIADYTGPVTIALYDSLFADALMLALEAKLALALLGDRAIYTAKLKDANDAILTARVRDGNEGLTTYEHVPDWLQVRGVSSMTPATWQNPSYGPLFSV